MRGCTCHGLALCPQCAALAARAGVLAPVVPAVSEKAFMAAVVRLAREHGWLCYHVHDSRRSLPGYPDLTLVHPTRHVGIWAELKVEGGVVTLQQAHWIAALGQVRETAAFVWTPEDWPRIEERLKGEEQNREC
jgi:hypothetical protein